MGRIHISIPMGTKSTSDFPGGFWKHHPFSGSAFGQVGGQTEKVCDIFVYFIFSHQNTFQRGSNCFLRRGKSNASKHYKVYVL